MTLAMWAFGRALGRPELAGSAISPGATLTPPGSTYHLGLLDTHCPSTSSRQGLPVPRRGRHSGTKTQASRMSAGLLGCIPILLGEGLRPGHQRSEGCGGQTYVRAE